MDVIRPLKVGINSHEGHWLMSCAEDGTPHAASLAADGPTLQRAIEEGLVKCLMTMLVPPAALLLPMPAGALCLPPLRRPRGAP